MARESHNAWKKRQRSRAKHMNVYKRIPFYKKIFEKEGKAMKSGRW